MKNVKKALLATAISAATCSTGALAEASFMESMKDSKSKLSFRYRMEDVSQDGKKDAMANTVKMRLNFETGAYNGFSGFVEFDNVSEINEVKYNDGLNGMTDYAAIVDPAGTDWNQTYVRHKSEVADVKYGRQRIILDNQRFIGGVGWRQNEQTFDGFTAGFKSGDKFKASYAHITNVNTIKGTNIDSKDDLLNLQYTLSDAAVLTGYGYMLSKEDVKDSKDNTFGASLTGKTEKFSYRAEYAQQDYEAGTTKYSATYAVLKGDVKAGPVKIGAAYEVLGADGANGAFGTAYGTKHAFQGWADKFLATPAGGIVDTNVSLHSKAGPVTLGLIYHSFESDDTNVGAGDLGSEIDFVAKGKAGPVGLMFKYADYKEGDLKNGDTKKLWLMATLAF